MSTRFDRWQAACMLAQLIAEGPADRDAFRLEQAFTDLREELAAARQNQADFPAHAARALELINNSMHSVKADEPHLQLVKGGAG